MFHYLEAQEVLIIHAKIIDETGGSHGIREIDIIASAIERPKMRFGGKDLYPTIFDKTAAYFESLALHHPFIDGNKRTAITAAARFLYLNGRDLRVANLELESFVLNCIIEKSDLKIIAQWFRENSVKFSRKN